MVFNATFNNISAIPWRYILLVEETVVPGENNWSATSQQQTLSHNVVLSTPGLSGVRTHNVSGDGNWLHRCHKSNYTTDKLNHMMLYQVHYVIKFIS